MAVAFQTISAAGPQVGGTLTFTKPSGLSLNDLMLAQVISYDGGTPTTPSGWTNLGAFGFITVMWKIANSTDVAAANFSFTTGGSIAGGSLSRYSGTSLTAPIDQINGGVSTGWSTSGITPSQANTVFVIMTENHNNSTDLQANASGYAIATNNPTWTEDADNTSANFGGNSGGYSIAHGSRAQNTASGTASATPSRSISNGSILVLDIQPPVLTAGNFLMFM